jgi:CBS domain-containing protein
MTVRAILDSKGHHIESVEPDAKLAAAIKILSERKIGALLVMSKGRLEGILSERAIESIQEAIQILAPGTPTPTPTLETLEKAP